MSSRNPRTLIDFQGWTPARIEELFSVADSYAVNRSEHSNLANKGCGRTGALLFFEPSTRTRMSFETACAHLGVYPLRFDGAGGTSLEKGESLEDTILNVAAMEPAFLVVRVGDELNLQSIADQISLPILNAGWGKSAHPTQALGDLYTIRQNLKSEKPRVLIVGDIRHSRVASSHLQLAKVAGYEVAFCAPPEFLPLDSSQVRVFQTLKEGLQWAHVVMALRVQLERHAKAYSLGSYRSSYGLTLESLQNFSATGLILHPGPINQGTELDAEVLKDPRCRVLDQVRNGVMVRQALIQLICEQEK